MFNFEKARYVLKNRKGSVIATIAGGLAIGLGLASAMKPIDEDYDDVEFEEVEEEETEEQETSSQEEEG